MSNNRTHRPSVLLIYTGGTIGLTDVTLEQFTHLTADVAGGILQYMLESCTLAMQVGQKVFCSLRQVHNSFQIDNLGCR